MTAEQIKILSELERKYSRYPHPEDLRYKKALTAAIDYIRDTSEMLEAATEISFLPEACTTRLHLISLARDA